MDELWVEKNVEGNGLGLIDILIRNFLGGSEENHEIFQQKWCPGRHSNRGPTVTATSIHLVTERILSCGMGYRVAHLNLLDYTASHLTRQYSSYLPVWELLLHLSHDNPCVLTRISITNNPHPTGCPKSAESLPCLNYIFGILDTNIEALL
jgi:hypothetical protein